MLNPLKDPKLFICIGEFIYAPSIARNGKTVMKAVCCLRCLLDTQRVVELVELWKNPEIGIAYCPLCNQEAVLSDTFRKLRKEVRKQVSSSEWKISEYGDFKIMQILKNAEEYHHRAN